jgi:hypothetical protein
VFLTKPDSYLSAAPKRIITHLLALRACIGSYASPGN